MRIEEKMIVLPALYIIKRRGSATTSDLIRDLTIVFNPSGEDAEILSGRNDTKFSQKVRNLVSHRDTNGMSDYTDFEIIKPVLKKILGEFKNVQILLLGDVNFPDYLNEFSCFSLSDEILD